jgi:zinc/manganese transport system substrate-binding protein
VEPKPSFHPGGEPGESLHRVGRELEIGWLPPLLNSSRNAKIQPGAKGYLDASLNVHILGDSDRQITRAMGDVHPSGNPTTGSSRATGRLIAQAIRDKLTRAHRRPTRPISRSATTISTSGWRRPRSAGTRRCALQGHQVVTYHRSWPNFMERLVST